MSAAKKYVIVGGVAGGATAAARLRRLDEQAQIVMFERGEHISYANCGLPYYLGGVIRDRERLFVQTPEKFYETLAVEARTLTEVLAIDRARKVVKVRDLRTGRDYEEAYDKLVLSPGAEPVRPPITGIQNERIFTIRNVADTDKLKSFVDREQPKKAVIVGAGFIGLEMAENLHHRGLAVTIVEMSSQVMTMLDFDLAAEVHAHLKAKGVEFYLGDGVQSFAGTGGPLTLKLSSGRELSADLVVLSIGVRPDTRLAAEAGLEIGVTKGIKVDPHLRTNDPNIYAVGDAIEFASPLTGQPTITYLAGPANKQGRLAADNLVLGDKKTYKGAIATAVAKVFDLTVASTGVGEKTLKKANLPFHSVVIHPSSHAGYYPGATAMTLKLLFSPEGKVYGAQAVGYDGVDKRIDLIASVVGRGGTVEDLTELEHAYAPPYSSAKDPVNQAGFVAENVLAGRSRFVTWDKLAELGPDTFYLDVRLPEEHAIATLPGAVNIPLPSLRERLKEVPTNRPVVVFCGVGLRAYLAERILRQNGFEKVYNLSGGYKTWEHSTQKQSNEDLFSRDFIGRDDHLYQADVDKGRSWAAAVGAGPGGAGSGGAAEGPGGTAGATARFAFPLVEVDASGLQCPGPIQKLKQSMDQLQPGQRLKETATDPGFAKDVASWCRMTGNTLIELTEGRGSFTALIEKASPSQPAAPAAGRGLSPAGPDSTSRDTTLVVFSDALDRALASLVIANGAASAGKKVTLFFTFWGLSILKRRRKPRGVKKDLMGRMFGWMLPRHLDNLALSKINMGGMGAWMMKLRMKALGIDDLGTMLAQAQAAGIRLVACQMSMDVMGVKAAELIEGVEIGGVASFLEASDTAAATLFL